MGYEHPMPVQEEVIPYLLGVNNDVVALAQTGTGKTAAYGLPVLQKVDARRNETQALILSPTRELCLQIADDLENYSKYLPGVRVLPVYGGANIEPQIRTLRKGVQVIVATPGRLIDLMERKAASLEHVENVCWTRLTRCFPWGSRRVSTRFWPECPKITTHYSSLPR